MTVGSIIHALRQEKKLPQKSVAKYLNVSVSTVSNYEVDRHLPDIETLKKLADLYNVSVDYIVGHTNVRHKAKCNYSINGNDEECLTCKEKDLNKFYLLSENQRFAIINQINSYILETGD